MKRFGLLLLLFLVLPLCAQTEQDGEEKNSFGNLFRGDTYVWLFPHQGGPLRLSISYYGQNGGGIVRFCRPDGTLVKRVYTGVGGVHTEECDFGPDAPRGVYQIRSFHRGVKVQVRSRPVMDFGIMPPRAWLHANRQGQFSKVYFMIPKDAKKLAFECRECHASILDGADQPVRFRKKEADLSGKGGQIWSADLKMKPIWPQSFRITSFTPVFCPSQETALRIGEVSFTGAGGKRYPSAFQAEASRRLAELEKKLPPIPDKDLSPYVKMVKGDPGGRFLFGKRGVISVFQAMIRKSGGKCDFQEEPALPAVLFTLDKPYNPWYHSPVLKQYILREGMRFLMKIDDADCYSGGWTGRGAEKIFSLAYAFALTAPELENRDRELWKEGLIRVADRYSMYQSWQESRSTLWPVILELVARGTGDRACRIMGGDFIRITCLPENGSDMQTGYQREIMGCDPHAQGIGVLNTALYYRMTGNRDAYRGLKTIFSFLNCSCCPGEQGKVVSASNFASVDPEGWDGRLFAAESALLLRGRLSEADCWSYPPDSEESLPVEDLMKVPGNVKAKAVLPDSPWFVRYLYPPAGREPSLFPALSRVPFVHDFNQEFSAVRTRSWFLFVYAGQNLKKRSWLEKEYRRTEAKLRPASPVNKRKNRKWDMVPGISLLSSDRWGPFLLSKSWNGYTMHMVCCEKGKAFLYPDFWNNRSKVLEDGSVVIETQTRPGTDVKIVRTVTPRPAGVKVRLQLKKSPAAKLKIYEQIPWIKEKNFPAPRYDLGGKWTDTPCAARYLRFGQGAYLGFDRKVKASFGPDTEKEGIRLGCLRISLEDLFTEEGELDFTYEIRFAR